MSHYQGRIDVAAVRAGGFRFCAAKATEGVDYEDPEFGRTLASIAAQPTDGPRFYPGAYHFARPDHHPGRSGGEDEAEFFTRALRSAADACGLSLASDFFEPILDFETYCDNAACGTADHAEWIDGFMSVLIAQTGRRGIIYTGANVWRYQAGDTDRFARAGIPLWQTAFSRDGADPGAEPPRIPSDASRTPWVASVWQWSGGGQYAYHGPVPGVQGDADVDRLMGDESLLSALTRASPAVTQDVDALADPWPPTRGLGELVGQCDPYTARVQGCLLGLGYGPKGLVASATGLPDGIFGPRTEAALREFKRAHGLPDDDRVDEQTWWHLVNSGLR